MPFLKKLIFILLLILCFTTTTVFCAEIDGWIKGDTCLVFKSPNTKAKIVGIIINKTAVTVEDVGYGWLKIVFAPVRDLKDGKRIECAMCYIPKSNFTTVFPTTW